ncbi:patatin-like phospholipase [Pseudoduganella lurida]|uniref:Patatin-like phospholipase n=1 Tax=Pseudoduganella lurida TaxID=1036180 RepID=A0A562RB20_9BURK|nr:patatin-like phospholipase family protein [Pseudoduganella lurida]TWI66272.1 patatin-like phospholipase [Pseudoduganella lurida]
MSKPMALILQGGGALGAFEYGVVTALVEEGWQPKAVTGVSIGAINAASIAGAKDGDIVTSLRTMWEAITLPQLPIWPATQQADFSLLGNPNFWRSRTDYWDALNWTSYCDTAPMLNTLATLLDFDQLNNPDHMRFGVTATSLNTGGQVTFSNYTASNAQKRSGQLRAKRAQLTPSHIVASGSLPPGFPATTIDGTDYWDGGLFSNTPVDSLLNLLEPEDIETLPIFVVDLFPTDGQASPVNLQEVNTRAIALQYQNRFWDQYGGDAGLDGFLTVLEQIRKLAAGNEVEGSPAFDWLMRLRALKNVHVIASAPAPAGGDHDFSQYGVRGRFAAGKAAALNYLSRLEHQAPATQNSVTRVDAKHISRSVAARSA